MQQSDRDVDVRQLADRKILLVEDEERLQVVVRMMLEELGATVSTAREADGAIALFKSEGEFDLVLLDILLEETSGVVVFDEIIRLDPSIKVVLSSGVLPDEDVFDKMKAHGAAFIEKPYSLETLGRVLKAALES